MATCRLFTRAGGGRCGASRHRALGRTRMLFIRNTVQILGLARRIAEEVVGAPGVAADDEDRSFSDGTTSRGSRLKGTAHTRRPVVFNQSVPKDGYASHQMIVYQSTKADFVDVATTRDIEAVILEAFEARMGRRVAPNEVRSWKESLQAMSKVLNDEAIPDDTGVAVEYGIPQTSKRVDMLLSGRDEAGRANL